MLDKSRQYLKFMTEEDINMKKSKRRVKKRISRLSNVSKGSRSKSEIRGSIKQFDKSKSELGDATALLHKKIGNAGSRA